MKLSDFDYQLPRELIARYPAPSRELSRMLVLKKSTGEITHTGFREFPAYIKTNDILALNDTKVVNARLIGNRRTGGRVEIFLLEDIDQNRFKALIKPSGRLKEGEEITFGGRGLRARLLAKQPKENIIEFYSPSGRIDEDLREIGTVPLPPYLRRKAEPLDAERYQTVYARKEGATAAPTAGLHFTEDILEEIASKGVKLTHVTLHVNYGTFAPVRTPDIAGHEMHSETFELSEDSAAQINRLKASGGRVFAAGTTSCRVLETCAKQVTRSPPRLRSGQARHHVTSYKVEGKKGKTNLFIYPPYKFKIVDTLLTNFHLPKSTLLMLVCAFAGKELIFKAYREAIEKRYRFFSYGDCMLIV